MANGRDERQESIRVRIEKKINSFIEENTKISKNEYGEPVKRAPRYLMDYYNYISERGRNGASSMRTRDSYLNIILRYLQYLKDQDVDVSSAECFGRLKPSVLIDNYLPMIRGLSKSGKAVQMYALKSFFTFLKRNGYISENPFADGGIKIPKEDFDSGKIVTLSKKEIRDTVKKIKSGRFVERGWMERDLAIFMIAVQTGMRISEIVELNVSDIDFSEKEIIITGKGDKKRIVYLDDNLLETIRTWIEKRDKILFNSGSDTDALFISNHMKRVSDQAVRDMIKRCTKAAGHEVTPHKLRATCATNALNDLGDMQLVSEMLGHSDISTTKRYAKENGDRLREAFKKRY